MRVTVNEEVNLEIELIGKGGRVTHSATLKEGTDFTFKNGIILLLRGKEGNYTGMSEVGPLTHSTKYRLRRSMDDGLVGKTSDMLAFMCLFVIPAGGYGTELNYWKRVEPIQVE